MASYKVFLCITAIALLSDFKLEASVKSPGFSSKLTSEYYDSSCPKVNEIIMSVLENAIAKDPRMAASLLRLHFHDCFVQGCDASVLLDDSPKIVSEKNAGPNKNSLRGFEVIDEIKQKLEQVCPKTVSCSDILAIASRDSVVISGGPHWEVQLGRKDSRTANMIESNRNIPAPNSTISILLSKFRKQGLDPEDLVALSGGHTLGVARCVTFKQRLYDHHDETMEKSFYNDVKSICPKIGGDNIISPLDYSSPMRFDNSYFKLILCGKGLLNSDQILLTGNNGELKEIVIKYAEDEDLFFNQFAKSMVKLGNISPSNEYKGEIRRNCRTVN